VLSNLVNGGHRRIVVLTQYKSHSLDRHISTTWRLSPLLGNYVTAVPAQMRRGPHWFAGSADAIYQNLNLLSDERPDYICVFGADHIYRMDPNQMVAQHITSGAGVTVAGIRVPIGDADQFGIIETAADGRRIAAFREKPSDPVGLVDTPDQVYASMGNYVFTSSALIEAVSTDAADRDSAHDLGGNIIPMMVGRGDAEVYDFAANEVPGASERDRGYWRDVGTLDAYYDAHMDLVSVHPMFNLYNPRWPILTFPEPLAPREVRLLLGRSRRPRARLHGLRRRGHLRRRGARLGRLARRAGELLGPGGGLRAHARRRGGAPRDRAPGHRGQERAHPRGRQDRRGRRRGPRTLHGVGERHRGDRQEPEGRGLRRWGCAWRC